MSLALVALLSTAGCVSVQGEAGRPAPAASAHSGNAPGAQASTAPAAPPAVHDALGKAEERPARRSGKKRKQKQKEEGAQAPARRAGAVGPPARQDVRNPRRRAAPARPEPPRRTQPRPTYDMRTICATGQGVASAEIIALCRTTYGR
ncbi:hypothetical protein [Streptomyces pratensis]|uniref:hypothetical protein n=1 Tax=Streptomyces pratensis TaxID=1169025 RepID=UPI0036428616